MEDVIQIENRFYVLATSSLADDRTRVLKWGETFAVLNRFGDVESVGLAEQGLYHRGTRFLSRLVLRMGDKVPQLLRSTIQDDNAYLTLDMMNPDVYREGVLLPRGSVHLFRSKFLWQDVCYDKLRLANFGLQPIKTFITLDFAADYADIFQVRGTRREKSGQRSPAVVKEDSVVLSYHGLDDIVRSTHLHFSPRPDRLSDTSVRFAINLESKEETSLTISIGCEQSESKSGTVIDYGRAAHEAALSLEDVRHKFCHVLTSSARFNTWLSRSEADVLMMINGNPEGAYPYAGVPWFNTVFGRDGILTAMECLWAAPWIAKSVLRYLAENQATSVIPEQEAEPGKILHEMRHGEMANLKEVPFGKYYGSVDSTPLFVMLAGAYLECSGDLSFIKEIWPNVLAALDWIDNYGDSDKDGFVEYQAKGRKGLAQQGWKDSYDSVFHRDGSLANPPIALCEVQGYVYAAKRAAARMAGEMRSPDLADKLDREAKSLQNQFEAKFWDDELGMYVLALDGKKEACRVRSSNAGQCLWSGIASSEHASRLAESLFSEEMFCGWGVRTIGSGEARYNPMSYHNGSVWPHDNAIIAAGLARYGFKKEATRILGALFEASTFMELNRLPELFCGFHKRSDVEGPTLYPVACSPQAWAAASPYLLLASCLGLNLRPSEGAVEFSSPRLPDGVAHLDLMNLEVGDDRVDIRAQGEASHVEVETLHSNESISVRSKN